jgi:hypothetical protein
MIVTYQVIVPPLYSNLLNYRLSGIGLFAHQMRESRHWDSGTPTAEEKGEVKLSFFAGEKRGSRARLGCLDAVGSHERYGPVDRFKSR